MYILTPNLLDSKWVRMHEGRACIDGSVTFLLQGKPWTFGDQDQQVPAEIRNPKPRNLTLETQKRGFRVGARTLNSEARDPTPE